MFERKPKHSEGPVLLDRIVKSGAQRVAILGLHPGAGTRTVLAYLAREIHRRSWPLAVTSAPRLPLERVEEALLRPVTRLAVPEGTFIATAAGPSEGSEARLDRLETTAWPTPLGLVSLVSVTAGGEVDLHGPGEADSLKDVIGVDARKTQLLDFLKNFPKKRGAILIGPPGVGKTTLAYAVARDQNRDIIEMNASDARSSETGPGCLQLFRGGDEQHEQLLRRLPRFIRAAHPHL